MRVYCNSKWSAVVWECGIAGAQYHTLIGAPCPVALCFCNVWADPRSHTGGSERERSNCQGEGPEGYWQTTPSSHQFLTRHIIRSVGPRLRAPYTKEAVAEAAGTLSAGQSGAHPEHRQSGVKTRMKKAGSGGPGEGNRAQDWYGVISFSFDF